MNYKRNPIFLLALATVLVASARDTQSFNASWQLHIGRELPTERSAWQDITLPYAHNGAEAFARDIAQLTDTIAWYRKSFTLPDVQGRKVFLEFEGFRQRGDVWVNGRYVGMSENGVMAAGFDVTPYVGKGRNEVLVRTDNDWRYRSTEYNSRYQWNDKNFNANYGGIPKNVWLHVTDDVYQTLPLYSNLGTTGTYIYATDYDIPAHAATIHAESQVTNEGTKHCQLQLRTQLYDVDGRLVAAWDGKSVTLPAGQTATLHARQRVQGLHFWSWGHGYLYNVVTTLVDAQGREFDRVTTRTGFRKTEFKEGKTWLNDRVLLVHGYAQRTSNEWPGVGLSVPAWLSDYSNALMVQSGGNMVRWMHVTPWKQDIESCDRVGLPQAMPAGDSEADVSGARWQQRVQVMRDAIIYNRNNPSILFYEGGNKGISEQHIAELKALRDQYDPHGGRAIGSREMLDSRVAEYGGEMLYINKSAGKPLWAMEYCRDEGLRKYWDSYSYPYHRQGDGPLYRGAPAMAYNHNQDHFAVEMVRRWFDYWQERPGTGRRVSGGGVKIVFSDTNTHHRGQANYRTSGVVDAMRIPKDAFYAHQVMWSGWVDDEAQRTHIIGHWNYPEGTVKPVYVVSTADSVRLELNGSVLPAPRRDYHYLFTVQDVQWQPGTLVAVGCDREGRELSRDTVQTVGAPHHLQLTAIQNPQGFRADGADMALIQIEVMDSEGRRCPLANHSVQFTLQGQATWLGGIAFDTLRADNYVGSTLLPVECGINRALIRSTTRPGTITLKAEALGLPAATLVLQTQQPKDNMPLPPTMQRMETPQTPSYRDVLHTAQVDSISVDSNEKQKHALLDDNERTEWRSNGNRQDSWATFHLSQPTAIREVVLKLSGWRLTCYPLAIYAGDALVWQGITPATLGYVHLPISRPVEAQTLTVRQVAPFTQSNKFGEVKELAAKYANTMEWAQSAEGRTDLRIIEVDLLY